MDDALLVRRTEGTNDLGREIVTRRGGSGAESRRAQRAAFEQLHDRVGHTVGTAEIVDGEDTGMREGGNRARFTLESAQPIGVGRKRLGQDLDGHVAIETGIGAR